MSDPAPAQASFRIGMVLNELGGEFPDVSVSKIRYLEEEGLVKPARTAAGYRMYTYADIERLRFVLACQRDNHWPLKVIRQHLEDFDHGIVPDLSIGRVRVPRMETGEDGFPTPEAFAPRTSTVRLSREDLLEAAGIDDELLDAIEQYGLIERRPNQSYYDSPALAVAALVGEFAASGIEPRHLRTFKIAADRQVGLFEQILAPGRRASDPHSRREVAEAAQRLAALSVRLHAVLVRNGLAGFA